MLTAEQEATIRKKAREVVYAEAMQNWDYLKSIVDWYVADLTAVACADAVASDEDGQRDAFPDFDPETGEPWPDEDLALVKGS